MTALDYKCKKSVVNTLLDTQESLVELTLHPMVACDAAVPSGMELDDISIVLTPTAENAKPTLQPH